VQREHAEKAKGDGTLMIRSTGEFDELQLRLDAVEDELFSTHSLLSMARQKNARLSERLEELHEERLKTSHQYDVEDARAELAVQADTNKRLAARLKELSQELSQKLDHSHALEADAQEARAELAVQADTNKRLAARVQSLQEIVDKLDIQIPNLPNLASQVYSLPLDGSA
jgi:chromosome segregation ATPase